MATSIKVTLELDDKGYLTGIKTATDQTAKLAVETEKAASKASGMFGNIATGASEAIGKLKGLVAAYAGIQAIQSALTLGDQLNDLSKATDISIQKILQLQSALMQAGGDGEDAAKMISNLQNTLDAAAQGGSAAQEQMLRLGFSFKDMTNLSPEQALQKTIEKLASMTNATERNALAFAILGKSARNINWEEVAEKVGKSADGYDQAAAAAKRAGDLFDRLAESAKNAKIGLMIAIEPLADLFDLLGKITGGSSGGLVMALAFAFKTLAIGVATAGLVIKGVVDDIKTLVAVIPALVDRDWDKVGKIFAANANEMKKDWANLAEFIDKQDLFGQNAKQPETTTGKPNAAGAASAAALPYYAKEVEALKKLSEEYKRNSTEKIKDIQISGLKLGMGEDEVAMMDALNTTTKKYNDTMADLLAKRAQESSGPQNAASKAKIAQLDIEMKKISDVYDMELQRVPEVIRAKNELIALDKLRIIQLQDQNKMSDALFSNITTRGAIGLTSLAKQYLEIDMAIKKANSTAINAEGIRRFGQDTFLDPNFKPPQSFLDWTNKVIADSQKLAEFQKGQAASTYELQRQFSSGWADAYTKYKEDAENAATESQTYFKTFSTGFEDAFVKMVQTGKLSFKDLANSLIADFARIQAKKALLGIFDMGGADSKGAGFSFGTLFGSIGKIFGFANGGNPPVNRPSIVGENGPELFVPKQAGTIISNGQFGTGGQVINNQVTYSIQAVDASSFRSLLARDPEFIHNVAEQGRRSLPIRSRR